MIVTACVELQFLILFSMMYEVWGGDGQVILYSISFIYLLAFSSLFVQIPGLYGSDGLEPVQTFLKRIVGKQNEQDTSWGWV